MITKVSGLAMVLAITLAVSTPALADKPIPGYPDYGLKANGQLMYQGDVGLGKCSDLLQQRDKYTREPFEEAAKACEAAGYSPAGYSAPLADTGGPPIILAPIALLVAGGLLIRKSIAL